MKIKAIALALVLVLIVCTVTSCAVSEEEIVGSWAGVYYAENGNYYEHVITLTRTKDFAYTVYKNGKMDSARTGYYSIEGKKVILIHDDYRYGRSEYKFKYKNGSLTNGIVTLDKVTD